MSSDEHMSTIDIVPMNSSAEDIVEEDISTIADVESVDFNSSIANTGENNAPSIEVEQSSSTTNGDAQNIDIIEQNSSSITVFDSNLPTINVFEQISSTPTFVDQNFSATSAIKQV